MPTDALAGAILGCAVGDAIGLPYEGLSRRRGAKLFGAPDRHRFIGRRGMVSDDTEHACMVAQSLCASPTDPELFARQLGRRLRWWLAGLPAGIGHATLKATLKLWLGCSPAQSGVYSAGNGPAMRSPLLGAAIDDVETLRRFVRASTLLTHTDPKALHGAFAVAIAAWCAKRGIDEPAAFFKQYRSIAGEKTSTEFDALIESVEKSLAADESTEAFADQSCCREGVSGYIYRTVPVVLHAWLRQPRDYRQAILSVVRCGGDTDTTAAILGSIIGAGVGQSGISQDWLDGLWEWPRSVRWMKELAEATDTALRTGATTLPPRVMPMAGLARNALFLAAVLGHAARRALPPY